MLQPQRSIEIPALTKLVGSSMRLSPTEKEREIVGELSTIAVWTQQVLITYDLPWIV